MNSQPSAVALPGNSLPYLETFLVVTVEVEDALGIKWVEATDAARTPLKCTGRHQTYLVLRVMYTALECVVELNSVF